MRAKQSTHSIRRAGSMNSIDFSPHNKDNFLTGGTDMNPILWDMRRPNTPVKVFVSHRGGVNKVEWHPHNQTIFGSCSDDKSVNVWDLTKIGAPQSQEEAKDGPPELIFIHGGHRSAVADFGWNIVSDEELMIASVEQEMNSLHIWSMAQYIYKDDYEG